MSAWTSKARNLVVRQRISTVFLSCPEGDAAQAIALKFIDQVTKYYNFATKPAAYYRDLIMNVAYFGIKLALSALGLYKSINNYYERETKYGAHNFFLYLI